MLQTSFAKNDATFLFQISQKKGSPNRSLITKLEITASKYCDSDIQMLHTVVQENILPSSDVFLCAFLPFPQ